MHVSRVRRSLKSMMINPSCYKNLLHEPFIHKGGPKGPEERQGKHHGKHKGKSKGPAKGKDVLMDL